MKAPQSANYLLIPDECCVPHGTRPNLINYQQLSRLYISQSQVFHHWPTKTLACTSTQHSKCLQLFNFYTYYPTLYKAKMGPILQYYARPTKSRTYKSDSLA